MSATNNGTQTGARLGSGPAHARKLVPCGWRTQLRLRPTTPYLTVGCYETRDEADDMACRAIAAARADEWYDAEVLITPIRRDAMSHEWNNEAYQMTLVWKASGGDLYITHPDRHTVHKHYEWWQRNEAEQDADMLAEALDLLPKVTEVA